MSLECCCLMSLSARLTRLPAKNSGTTQRFNVILVTHDLREAVYLADTVYVMSKRPGRILAKREIELPRPRDLEITYSEAFTTLVYELREQIGSIRKG